MPAISKRVKNLYRVQQEDCLFLFKHPAPSSLIAEEMQARYQPGIYSSPAADWRGIRLMLLVEKAYSSSAHNLRITSYAAIMGGYQLFLWERFSTCIDLLPDNKKSLAKLLQAEALHLSKQEINARRRGKLICSGYGFSCALQTCMAS